MTIHVFIHSALRGHAQWLGHKLMVGWDVTPRKLRDASGEKAVSVGVTKPCSSLEELLSLGTLGRL